MEVHNIDPIYNEDSEVLILGSFPSVKSREQRFFYAHPQNRFWGVISYIFSEIPPKTIEEKKKMLLKNNIAIWDVIKSCDIVGSSDSSIENVVVNDIDIILKKANIKRIFANGGKAYKLFKKYISNDIEIIKLPSTSPANAQYNFERLCREWKDLIGLSSK